MNGINSAQKDPSSFFSVQPTDGSGNNIGKIQKLFDNNQLPSKSIDNVSSAVKGHVRISNRTDATQLVIVRGIFPEIEKDVSDINTKISSGAYRLNEGQV